MDSGHSLRQQAYRQALSLVGAILLALLVGVALLAVDGYAPGNVLKAAYSGTFSSGFRFANTMSRLSILVLATLAAAIPFKAGIWNIGGEGQLAIGAFATAFVGFSFPKLPAVVLLPMAILAGMLAGAAWAAIPAALKLALRANEIVTTIMMNYVASFITSYLVNYPFRAPGAANAETVLMPASITLKTMVPLSSLTTGAFLALFAFFLVYFIDKKSVWGYEWRVLGSNEEFARYGGVDDKKMRFLAMCIGGALAGLAGAILVLGVYHKFIYGISASFGLNGVLVTLIAANSPILILIVAIIFAFVQSGVIGMESKLTVATETSSLLMSLIILVVIIRSRLVSSVLKLAPHRKSYGSGD